MRRPRAMLSAFLLRRGNSLSAALVALLCAVGVSGCDPFGEDEVRVYVSYEATGLDTENDPVLHAYAEQDNSTFAQQPVRPGPALKSPVGAVAGFTLSGVTLNGDPLQREGDRSFRQELEEPLAVGVEHVVAFDLSEGGENLDPELHFTFDDYTLHGLPPGDTITRGDTLRLTWRIVEQGWDTSTLHIYQPPWSQSGLVHEVEMHDDSVFVLPTDTLSADSLSFILSRHLSAWYATDDTHGVYYTLEGARRYALVDP